MAWTEIDLSAATLYYGRAVYTAGRIERASAAITNAIYAGVTDYSLTQGEVIEFEIDVAYFPGGSDDPDAGVDTISLYSIPGPGATEAEVDVAEWYTFASADFSTVTSPATLTFTVGPGVEAYDAAFTAVPPEPYLLIECDEAWAVSGMRWRLQPPPRRNRAGGLSLSGSLPLTFDPAVTPVPRAGGRGGQAGHQIIAATAFDLAGHPATVSKVRDRQRLVIGGRDMTFPGGVATEFAYQYVSPLLYGPASVTLPDDQTVVGDRWKTVKIQRVDADGNVTGTDYRGFTVADGPSDGLSSTIEVGGEASGRAAMRHKPLPVFPSRKRVGRLAYRLISEMGLRFKPFLGPSTPDIQIPKLGGMNQLAAIAEVCAQSQKKDGTQYTIMPDADGRYRLTEKDTTTIDFTLYPDGSRVKADLLSDGAEEPNRIFANAVTPNGERLTGIVVPGFTQVDAPPPWGGVLLTEGSVGADVTLMIARLQIFDFLDRRDSPGGYDADVTDAVEDFQAMAGLAQTGDVNQATWNALWDLNSTGFSLGWSHREPAAQLDVTRRWDRSASGAIIRKNPTYNRRVPNVDLEVDLGAEVTRKQRKRFARGELKHGQQANWIGRIEVPMGAVIAGEHNPGDSLTTADLMDFRDVRPGMNCWLPTFQGGTLVHVAGSDPIAGTMLVDTRARDAKKVWEIYQRAVENRGNPSRAWARAHRSSNTARDVVEWDGVGGQLGIPIEVTANTWVAFPVRAGGEGTIRRLLLQTSPPAEFVCAVFGQKIRAPRLQRLIGDPLTEAGHDNWTDREDDLDDDLLRYVAGSPDDPCGYDRPKSRGGTLNGRWNDRAGFPYRTFKYPVLYVAVRADRATEIQAGRIMWPLLEPGA